MEELDDLIHKLNSDAYQAVSITDLDTGAKIAVNLLGSEIILNHGSAEQYFEKLNKKGHRHLMIYPRRKNGNSFKAGVGFKVKFSPDDDSDFEQPQTLSFDLPQRKQTSAKPKKKKKKNKGVFGMGAADILDLKISASQVDRLQQENIRLQAKNDLLETENKQLKEAELKNKYDASKQSVWVDIAKGVVDKAPGMMGMFLKSVANAAEAVPMAAAEPQHHNNQPRRNNIPEVKAKLISEVHRAKNDMAELLLVIYQNVIKESTEDNPNEFPMELYELLQKHQIISE